MKHKNLETGTVFMWDRNKFIDRKFMMQEMYQYYVEGDPEWNKNAGTVCTYLLIMQWFQTIRWLEKSKSAEKEFNPSRMYYKTDLSSLKMEFLSIY